VCCAANLVKANAVEYEERIRKGREGRKKERKKNAAGKVSLCTVLYSREVFTLIEGIEEEKLFK